MRAPAKEDAPLSLKSEATHKEAGQTIKAVRMTEDESWAVQRAICVEAPVLIDGQRWVVSHVQGTGRAVVGLVVRKPKKSDEAA